MMRKLCLLVVLGMALASRAWAQQPKQLSLEYYGLGFGHLVEFFQKSDPEAVFVMAPGVADRSTTFKAGRQLSLEDAIVAASAAADVEVTHTGNIYVFRLRPRAVPVPAPPQEAKMPAAPPPADFPGAATLIDLHVKNASLPEVMDQLVVAAVGRKAGGGIEIVVEPEMLKHILVTADVYKRPLAEVLTFLSDQAGLAYTARTTPQVTTLYFAPRPSLVVNRRAAIIDGQVGLQEVRRVPGPAPRPDARKPRE